MGEEEELSQMGMPQHASQGEGAAHFGGGSAQHPETSSVAGEGDDLGGVEREGGEIGREWRQRGRGERTIGME